MEKITKYIQKHKQLIMLITPIVIILTIFLGFIVLSALEDDSENENDEVVDSTVEEQNVVSLPSFPVDEDFSDEEVEDNNSATNEQEEEPMSEESTPDDTLMQETEEEVIQPIQLNSSFQIELYPKSPIPVKEGSLAFMEMGIVTTDMQGFQCVTTLTNQGGDEFLPSSIHDNNTVIIRNDDYVGIVTYALEPGVYDFGVSCENPYVENSVLTESINFEIIVDNENGIW